MNHAMAVRTDEDQVGELGLFAGLDLVDQAAWCDDG